MSPCQSLASWTLLCGAWACGNCDVCHMALRASIGVLSVPTALILCGRGAWRTLKILRNAFDYTLSLCPSCYLFLSKGGSRIYIQRICHAWNQFFKPSSRPVCHFVFIRSDQWIEAPDIIFIWRPTKPSWRRSWSWDHQGLRYRDRLSFAVHLCLHPCQEWDKTRSIKHF